MAIVEIKVPDIGGSSNVDVIEVLVKVGDTLAKEDSMITLETDKATMEVPAPEAGVVKSIAVKVGDKISEGSLILTLESATAAAAPAPKTAAPVAAAPAPAAAPAAKPAPAPVAGEIQAQVVVLGGGPGGYTAAFRAADLGKQVVLVERYSTLGGVCLNVGCIPSKALLHSAKVITDAEEMSHHGVKFGKPEIDIDAIRAYKEGVVKRLTTGLSGLAKQRKVQVVQGEGQFTSATTLSVKTADGEKIIRFEHAIIAAGSSVAQIPGYPYDDPRVISSTGALKLQDVPKRFLVIGGGIIGLEMGTVYEALGSEVTVIELGDGLIPGADRDIVKPLHNRLSKRFKNILLKTKVAKMETKPEGIVCTFEGDNAPKEPQTFDRVLVAVGRRPNGKLIGADKAGVVVDERGFIPVNSHGRTNVDNIYAIGDIVGNPMLAHKATYEAKIAAENIAGLAANFDALTIPSVAYTDPEIAWMGLTETEAIAKGIPYEKASFPWAASGRALGLDRDEGLTKIIYEPETHRILGYAIVGVNAGELIAEGVLALEMGADISDLGLAIHPHPTLSETLAFAAEMAHGSITDLFVPKKK